MRTLNVLLQTDDKNVLFKHLHHHNLIYSGISFMLYLYS